MAGRVSVAGKIVGDDCVQKDPSNPIFFVPLSPQLKQTDLSEFDRYSLCSSAIDLYF